MATGSVQRGRSSASSQFAIGLLLGLAIVLLTVLATLYELGYFPAQAGEAQGAPAVREEPGPKPTAVWRFRSEWLTPQSK
jgi:hypothetical protein